MGMNSFTWRLEKERKSGSSRSRRRSEHTQTSTSTSTSHTNVTGTYTRTLTKLEGISPEHLRDLRQEPRQSIDLTTLRKTYSDVPGLGRRITPRFPLKLSAVAYSPRGGSLRTESVNISASGALLRDPLPAVFMSGPFEILFIVTNPRTGEKKHLMFQAKAVGVGNESPRISFVSAANPTMVSLQTLFHGLDPLL